MVIPGKIFITSRDDIVYNSLLNETVIVSMDEDNLLMEGAVKLVGTCLLPPVQAKIAEADGNELMYDTIYNNHLLEPYQQEFISVLLALLYKGKNILLFLPEIGYTNTRDKFVAIMFQRYGIHIGILESENPADITCYYDERCTPIWCNMIYSTRVIGGLEYLYLYPVDAPLTNKGVLNDLLMEFNPYGKTIQEKINYLSRLHKKIHINPKVKPVIRNLRRD